MENVWNERYSITEYYYGETPNEFFKEELMKLRPGNILLPAEGEGRNAVFAAKKGWQVEAFDSSEEAKSKALRLAAKNETTISYTINDFSIVNYPLEHFDVLGLVYIHFPIDMRKKYFTKLLTAVKRNGLVIFEAFSKGHIHYQKVNPTVGGPKDSNMLYSTGEVAEYFSSMEIITLEETVVDLKEGSGHIGAASVIRFVGRKKMI